MPGRHTSPRRHEASSQRGWGGARPGAGRPPRGKRPGVSHLKRPSLSRRHPVHVTLRVVDGVPPLRQKKYGHVIFDALAAAVRATERSSRNPARRLRVTHFSIQRNHFHFVVEADGELALARGMQGLATRLARRLNVRIGRRGKLFADRYHARQLKTPLEVRRVLAYVLNNARKHSMKGPGGPPGDWADPYSSVDYFDGFKRLPSGRWPRAEFVLGRGPPVHVPKTWLLRKGWRACGLLVLSHVPGPRG